jgi:hypothetical protein
MYISMACVSPPELDDKTLLAYIDGEADPEVGAHLERCPHCRDRAQRLARLQDRLTSQLYRFTCPSPAELGEYHLGLLPSDQAADVASHLAECPHCTREIAQLKDYLSELKPDLEFSLQERIRVLVARLVRARRGNGASGALSPAYAGLRGEAEGPYLYQADDIQIAVEIQDDIERQGRKVLLGLVTNTDPQKLEVHLWQADRRITTTPVDELGTFIIPNVAPGNYELILSGPEVEIHIQGLEI